MPTSSHRRHMTVHRGLADHFSPEEIKEMKTTIYLMKEAMRERRRREALEASFRYRFYIVMFRFVRWWFGFPLIFLYDFESGECHENAKNRDKR